MPADAGIQTLPRVREVLDSRLRGNERSTLRVRVVSQIQLSNNAVSLFVIPGRGLFRPRTRNPDTHAVLASGFRVRSLRSRPGMTERESQRFAARVLCGAGYAVVHFRSLVKYEGMARREGASGSSIAHLPFGKMRRLSARHRGVLNGDGPRFWQPPAERPTTLRTRPLSGGRAIKPRTSRAARHQPAPGGRS
jgi:hypothetical protein